MVHRRQRRGFLQLNVSAWLCVLLALFTAFGCSASDAEGTDERAKVEQLAVICGVSTCPADTACATYKCDGRSCIATAARDGTACGIKAATGSCIGGECCLTCYTLDKFGSPVCQGRASAANCGSGGKACKTCSATEECTSAACSAGACVYSEAADDTACSSDGDACNGDEVCSGGKCQPPAAFTCDDDNACTVDSCDREKGCAHEPVSCDDENPCTDDACDAKGGCQHTAAPVSKQCDDGDVCNGIAVCSGKKCVAPSAGLNCDDGEICTDDSCDAEVGCLHAANTQSCSDNDLCTTKDTCAKGKCVGGAPPSCDDNESCTTDSCDSKVGCVHASVSNNKTCDDGNGCTLVDKCQAGKCVGSGGPTCDDDDPCTRNQCEVQTQLCSNPAQANGTNCIYDKCHQNSTCQNGACGEGELISCDDNNPCTTDSCDPRTGCKHVADNRATCSDGDACTHEDACRDGKCSGNAQVCSPLDSCHVAGECDAKSGLCNDPRAQDGAECPGGACEGGRCVITAGDGGAGSSEPGPGAGGERAAGAAAAGGARSGDGGEAASESDGGTPPVTIPDDKIFKRDPGGCSCNVPASRGRTAELLALLLSLGIATCRRRRARA